MALDSLAQDWPAARNILCVRLDSLGDVLMTTPAIRALKQSVPKRKITLLTSPAGAAVAPLIPEIDKFIVYEAPWMKATAPRASSQPDLHMTELLRENRFDAAVIFTVYSQNPIPSAMLCYLADIPLRLAHCRENTYQLLTDWVRETEPEQTIRHEVRRQLDLVASVGCKTDDERLSLQVFGNAHRHTAALLDELGLDRLQSWVVIHPGSTAASRRYSPDKFAAVAHALVERGQQIVFTGEEHERPLVDYIRRQMHARSISLVGRLVLAELAAVIHQAPLLIANNTGPVHIAAAVGTPVVDLYALTNPQHTPWLVPSRVLSHDVDCKFCYRSICPQQHHHCLDLIEPDIVVQASLELLDETQRCTGAVLATA
jgi:lipopolysaccharide heptosyltransferase II